MPPANTAAVTPRGALMASEIAEQPEVLRRILADGAPVITETR